MAAVRHVVVGTTATPLVAEGLSESDGTVTVLVQAGAAFTIGQDANVTVANGWSVQANTPFGVTPYIDADNLYGIVAAGTVEVEVWPSGPGV